MALIIQTQEEFVAKFNKMIYDYLCIIIPQGELDDNHIYKNPIIEYENWFMINGLSINRTPSLMDETDKRFSKSPLALKIAEMEEENKALNYELFNAKRLIKKKMLILRNFQGQNLMLRFKNYYGMTNFKTWLIRNVDSDQETVR